MALRWLTVAVLLLTWTLVFPTSQASSLGQGAKSPYEGRVGLDTSTVYLPAQEGYGYLERARYGGITWIREDFAWSVIEPSRGRLDWRRADTLMRNAARLGIDVLAVATYTPAWASGHTDSDKYPPQDPGEFARFVNDIALRYGRGGTFWKSHPKLPRRPLKAIEVWNEPWHAYFWRPAPDPIAYARLVRAAATAIDAAHSGINVIASGDIFQLREDGSDQGLDWLQPLLAADPALWRSGLVSAWSVHAYSQQLGPFDVSAPQRARYDRVLLTRSLSVAAGVELPIWITELGWNTRTDSPDAVSESLQAQYDRDALVRATVEWGSFVVRSFVYTLAKPSQEQSYNLLRPDGSARPAWTAIQELVAPG